LYLADLAYYSAYPSISQSEKYAEEALRLADSLKNPYIHIYALQSKANSYTSQRLYLKALQVNQEALVFEEENPF